MATIEERIVARNVDRIEAITIGNGFLIDIQKVFRSQKEVPTINEFPSIILDVFGEDLPFHLRKAQPGLIHFSAQMADRGYGGDELQPAIAVVMGELKKQIQANQFWDDGGAEGNLAIATIFLRTSPSTTEAARPIGSDTLEWDVYYRAKDDDPSALRVI